MTAVCQQNMENVHKFMCSVYVLLLSLKPSYKAKRIKLFELNGYHERQERTTVSSDGLKWQAIYRTIWRFFGWDEGNEKQIFKLNNIFLFHK